MTRLSVWFAVVLCVAMSIPVAVGGKPKSPKMAVQLYGMDRSFSTEPMIAGFTAYLILPDGSHALASCSHPISGPLCRIEAFAAEKRVKVPCDLLKGDIKAPTRECYQSESYWAERKGNDITLSTINGKVTYHIYGSW